MRISDWSSDVCSSDLLVTLPDGIMALVLPTEARDMPGIWSWLEKMVAGNGPIRKLVPVDVRQSMANGGGPACLRLRVVADPAHIDPRFLVDEAKLDGIADIEVGRASCGERVWHAVENLVVGVSLKKKKN